MDSDIEYTVLYIKKRENLRRLAPKSLSRAGAAWVEWEEVDITSTFPRHVVSLEIFLAFFLTKSLL